MIKPNMEFPGIRVWDNLLDDRFLLDLDEESNYYSWQLDNKANKISFPYGLKGSHLFWICTLVCPEYSVKTIPPLIENLYKFLIKEVINTDYQLKTIQINGQTLGQEGTYHTDNPPNSNEYTLMVFINHKWEEKWGGDFQIKNPSGLNPPKTHSIKYIPGRIILFDGSIPHRGSAPIKPNILRKSLVFRLKKV